MAASAMGARVEEGSGGEEEDQSSTIDPAFVLSRLRTLLPNHPNAPTITANPSEEELEAAEADLIDAGCVLWDLSASVDAARFMCEHHLVQLLLRLMAEYTAHSSRLLEVCVGILANVATDAELCHAIAEQPGLLSTLHALLLSTADSSVIHELVRLLRTAISSSTQARSLRRHSWFELLRLPPVLAQLLHVLSNTLRADLLAATANMLATAMYYERQMADEAIQQDGGAGDSALQPQCLSAEAAEMPTGSSLPQRTSAGEDNDAGADADTDADANANADADAEADVAGIEAQGATFRVQLVKAGGLGEAARLLAAHWRAEESLCHAVLLLFDGLTQTVVDAAELSNGEAAMGTAGGGVDQPAVELTAAQALETAGLLPTHEVWQALASLLQRHDEPSDPMCCVACGRLAQFASEAASDEHLVWLDAGLLSALLRLLSRFECKLDGAADEGARTISSTPKPEDDVDELRDGVRAIWVLLHVFMRRLDGIVLGLLPAEKKGEYDGFEMLLHRAGQLCRSLRWARRHPEVEAAAVAHAALEKLYNASNFVWTASPDCSEGSILRGINMLSRCLFKWGDHQAGGAPEDCHSDAEAHVGDGWSMSGSCANSSSEDELGLSWAETDKTDDACGWDDENGPECGDVSLEGRADQPDRSWQEDDVIG